MKTESPTTPVARSEGPSWGSDAIAQLIRDLDLRYIAFNPGSSYRGLHDSLVNFLGNDDPKMVLCLHDEHAVAIAHGYAKVLDKPMAVAIHANVGLMHASMAIFNAFCDGMPMVILGATGPMDAQRRRPFIEWVHTVNDQAGLIRGFCKWDDQPASVQAALDSVAHANVLTRTFPTAPTYVCFDADTLEQRIVDPIRLPDPRRFGSARGPAPSRETVGEVTRLLSEAERPLLLIGRVSRSESEWKERIALAEAFGTCVMTDQRSGGSFPASHELCPFPAIAHLAEAEKAAIRQADVILALGTLDLAGTLKQAFGTEPVTATVIACLGDFAIGNGWSKHTGAMPPIDVPVFAEPGAFVHAMVRRFPERLRRESWPPPAPAMINDPNPSDLVMSEQEVAAVLLEALADRPRSFVEMPNGWPRFGVGAEDPLDCLGGDGGAGLGSGPGTSIGSALALDGSGRIPIAVLGDGDLFMGSSALWTAAHCRIPILFLIVNNGVYGNDVAHQERVAITRKRPIENSWVGQQISDPTPDAASLARSYGLAAYGPITDRAELAKMLGVAFEQVAEGAAVLVDVQVST